MEPLSENNHGGKPASLRHRFALGSKDLLIILLATLLIGGWAMVRGKHASGGLLGRPLRVGIVQWPGYVGGLVANNGLKPNKDSDFWRMPFKDNQPAHLLVEFVLIDDEKELRHQLALGGEKGGVDVMWSTVDSLAYQFSSFPNEVRPRAFMQVDWSAGGDAIVADSSIMRVEDLKGKKIAVASGPSRWLLEYSLEKSSLAEPAQTSILEPCPSNAVPQAGCLFTESPQQAREKFEKGEVDAAVLWEPDVSEALKHRDGNILISTKTFDKLIADVMVADERFINNHKDIIQAFIEGWLIDGTTKARNDPMLAAKVLQKEPTFKDLGAAKTRDELELVTLATLKDNVEMFGLPGEFPRFDRLFNDANNLWLNRKYIKTRTQPEETRNAALLNKVYEDYRKNHPEFVASAGCASVQFSTALTLSFQPHNTVLVGDAKRTLTDKISSLRQFFPSNPFCIQVITDEGYEARETPDIDEARASSVVDYLATHFPQSKFVSAGSHARDAVSNNTSVPYIFLKLTSLPSMADRPNAEPLENMTGSEHGKRL